MHMGYVIPDRARHSEIELSNLNTYGGIASFFFNEIKRILRRSKDALKIRKKLFFFEAKYDRYSDDLLLYRTAHGEIFGRGSTNISSFTTIESLHLFGNK